MPEAVATLPDLVADLVAVRHAGGYRFKVPERVLRQFAEHCEREGYPDGSITKEAVDGFLYGRHLRASTVRRNELALRQLADHARTVGWHAYLPAAATRVRVRHQAPYVFTDDEVRRLFAAIDSQPHVQLHEQGDGRPGPVPGALRRRAAGLRGAEPDPVGRGHQRRDTADPRLEERCRAGPSRSPAGSPQPWAHTSRPRTRPPSPATTCSTAGPRAGRSTSRPSTCGSAAT